MLPVDLAERSEANQATAAKGLVKQIVSADTAKIPDIILVNGSHSTYAKYSHDIAAAVERVCPVAHTPSIDEMVADDEGLRRMSSYLLGRRARRLTTSRDGDVCKVMAHVC